MFFGNHERSRARRRGVVLILILGMLALMALIGVTFATFAGQSLVNNKNFAVSVNFPGSEQVMDFALAQLINDTNNPLSAIRGHSLLRDMYGNDSLLSGNAGAIRGYLDRLPNGLALQITAKAAYPTGTGTVFDYTGYIQYQTNIPTGSLFPQFYGLDFTHWILRVPATGSNVAQSLEVLEDNVSGATHLLTLSPADPLDPFGNQTTRIYNNPNVPFLNGDTTAGHGAPNQKTLVFMNGQAAASAGLAVGATFTLDCRYMRAFNGPGLSHANNAGLPDATYLGAGQPHNTAAFANFRTNGGLLTYAFATAPVQPTAITLGDPDLIGMDEDYDACDLENWFLALQSADGKVMIPSFHRPGILTHQDWVNGFNPANTAVQNAAAVMSVSKILRPRQVDNGLLFPADPVPDQSSGRITYDVDNDGDGITDSVWLDLGFPVQKDPRGKLFKPLFAFMVIGLNGRLPLNTAGNLQSRDFQTATVPAAVNDPRFKYESLPANYLDGSTWSHASHLGFSVNEINPLFALQNAPNLVYGNPLANVPSYTQYDNSGYDITNTATVSNNVGVGLGIDVIQLRNILAGTVPSTTLVTPNTTIDHDLNFVMVNDQPWHVPNSVMDHADFISNNAVNRQNVPVPGRWGEPHGIPLQLSVPAIQRQTPASGIWLNSSVYTNPVRAGRSFAGFNTSAGLSIPNQLDGSDDDYDALDFFPFSQPPSPPYTVTGTPNPSFGEGYYQAGVLGFPPTAAAGDYYEVDASVQLPVERIRRFVTPIDPSATGRLVSWTERPLHGLDYGQGHDLWGRTAYFRYFRPAGMPKTVTYDTWSTLATPAETIDRYNQPILMGPNIPDKITITPPIGTAVTFSGTNNLLHGTSSYLAPILGIGNNGSATNGEWFTAVMAPMPFDISNGGVAANPGITPAGYTPYPTITTSSPSTMSHQVNTMQGPLLAVPGPYHPSFGMAVGTAPVTVVGGYPNYPAINPVTNAAMPSSSLNKDEADEMNVYAPTFSDQPFGPSDLEWLYRKQDVDGAFLTSRLSQLAPVSFLNPADGATRRRLFSTDTFEPITFSYPPDHPLPLNSQDLNHDWNSRSAGFYQASGVGLSGTVPVQVPNGGLSYLNYNHYPVNPGDQTSGVFPTTQNINTLANIPDPVHYGNNSNHYSNGIPGSPGNALPYTPTAGTNNQLPPYVTPAIAHRDRKINLNFPLPVSNDPAEPIRQKWVRETYQLFKAVLPPQAVDTPEELAALSQYVVNIIDFRDPDCSATRFVNTDIMVVQATATSPSRVIFATATPPTGGPYKTATVPIAVTGTDPPHYPYDARIYEEQMGLLSGTGNPSASWTAAFPGVTAALPGPFLVQHGMEYSPLAINEALAYTFQANNGGTKTQFTRFALELVNTLTDDAVTGNNSDLGDNELDGWDIVVAPDNDGAGSTTGRPDPITGDIPPAALTKAAGTYHTQAIISATASPGTFKLVNSIPALRAGGATSARAYFHVGTKPPVVTSPASETPAFHVNDAELPTTFVLPTPGAGNTKWFWVYLRRPANPFERPASYTAPREMVVVDSMRFSYADGGGQGTVGTPPAKDKVDTAGSQAHFSAQRLQPYRGGQFVPTMTGGTLPSPPTAWGYSEQTAISTTSTTLSFGNAPASPAIAKPVAHTIGAANTPKENWNLMTFHDRDFMNVAELLLVPGCSPGLFTKQFIERGFRAPPAVVAAAGYLDGSLTTNPTGAAYVSTAFPAGATPVYPYLNDEFFYSAASVAPFTNPPTNLAPYPSQIGGMTGDGWYKLLEFVESPSSANGAIGPVATGTNFDWFRQDTKPGLINLNLIIDEEVFFGLIDDPRLDNLLALNTAWTSTLPQVVTMIDAFGYPVYPADTTAGTPANSRGYYPISDVPTYNAAAGNTLLQGRGYTYVDPTTGTEVHGLKGAFSDFLKLRSGGSGFLFAYGSGVTGSGPLLLPANAAGTFLGTNVLLAQTPVARERPFRSLASADINDTVMRPATLPPTPDPTTGIGAGLINFYTTPHATFYGPFVYNDNNGQSYSDPANPGTTLPLPAPFVGDPGLRNPYLAFTATNPRRLPTMPFRRLFQIPDTANTGTPPSNAAEFAFGTNVNVVNQPIMPEQLSANFTPVPTSNLFALTTNYPAPGAPAPTAPFTTGVTGLVYGTSTNYLGSNPAGTALDNRQHPYYRTEILQKVMNLTTVRTHQFAVWITVGFFEVLNTGTPYLGHADQLGAELGALAGKNIRYRSFFILDRTKAVGFSATSPIDFRDVVAYRRRIE